MLWNAAGTALRSASAGSLKNLKRRVKFIVGRQPLSQLGPASRWGIPAVIGHRESG